MWLYMFAVALLVLGAGGGLLFGGIFTIVLAPIGMIILVGALLSAMWARSTQGQTGGSTDASPGVGHPLPRTRDRPGARRPRPSDSPTPAGSSSSVLHQLPSA